MDWVQSAFIAVAILLLGYAISRLSSRLKEIQNQQKRLSLTFLKIENDIDHLHLSMAILAQDDPDKLDRVMKMKNRRENHFIFNLVNAPFDVSLALRGIEEPDIDDDPNYWNAVLEGDGRSNFRRSEPNLDQKMFRQSHLSKAAPGPRGGCEAPSPWGRFGRARLCRATALKDNGPNQDK